MFFLAAAGRCSHICNGGFITVEKFRGRGIGKLMAASFLKIARDLGYKVCPLLDESVCSDLSGSMENVRLYPHLGL